MGPLHRPAPGGQAPWVAESGFEPGSAFNYNVHLLDQGTGMEDGRVGDSGEMSRLRRRRTVWELSGNATGPCFSFLPTPFQRRHVDGSDRFTASPRVQASRELRAGL